MNSYSIAHLIHLFCAITFVGGVIFEIAFLSVLHTKKVSREARREVESALNTRMRRVMPFVIILLLSSGLVMLHHYHDFWHHVTTSSFYFQLSLKLFLAASVFIHFAIAITKMKRKTMTAAWSRYIHWAVFIQVIVIVFLAKSMFYFQWF